jgi:hypothetical protein
MEARASPVLLCLIAAAFAGHGTARAGPKLPPEFFGINLNRVFYDVPSLEHQDVLRDARAAGTTHGRMDLTWAEIEPWPPENGVHTYHWEETDRMVAALAGAHIRAAPILCYSAPWAARSWTDKSPPVGDEDFAAYAVAAAARYGPRGSFWQARKDVPYLPVRRWEIWNEENLTQVFWQTGRDAPRYARLYLAARTAVRGVDRHARVIIGGIWGDDVAYLGEMVYAHPELRGNVDGVGLHPYTRTAGHVLSIVRRFREGVDRTLGPGVPIDLTEVGWYQHGQGWLHTTDAMRAGKLALLADALARSNCGVEAFEPYTWLTAETGSDDVENWYGIYSPFFGPLTSAEAWSAATARYSGAKERMRARSASSVIPVCGPPVHGGPLLKLGIVSRHSHNPAGDLIYRLTVTYRGHPLEGAVVYVHPPLQPAYRRTTDRHGNTRIAFMPTTKVWATVGRQVARSPVKRLR